MCVCLCYPACIGELVGLPPLLLQNIISTLSADGLSRYIEHLMDCLLGKSESDVSSDNEQIWVLDQV